MLKVELVYLAYTLTAHISRYKLDLEKKLISLGITPATLKNLPVTNYPVNSITPSYLFVLGFFLGDGCLFLKLEWREKKKTIP